MFDVDRRSLLGLAAVLATASGARAADSLETIELWPQSPPGGPGPSGPEETSSSGALTKISKPRLIVYRPAHPDGTAVIVIGGGGYARIGVGTESTPTCQWLQSLGVTAFELIYRLPEDNWPPVAPFQDGQRALRIVRAKAGALGVDPARIGMIGFSAGGHLAGMTAVQPGKLLYPPVDPADAVSARPDFAALIYPVLTMIPPYDHTHTRHEILGSHPDEAESIAYSVERQVDANTPPIFLAQAADDPISPVENSTMMFSALRAAKVSAELHVFQSGGHGWGLGRSGTEVHAWPELFIAWAQFNKFRSLSP
jgi:acetyl esterase/lipase